MSQVNGKSERKRIAWVFLLFGAVAWGWNSYSSAQEERRAELAQIAVEIEAERRLQDTKARAAREMAAIADAAERERAADLSGPERVALEAALQHLRDVDRLLLLDWKGQDLRSSKRADVARGRPYRVDVYQEDGARTTTRARVDLDRDERWDEEWVFEPDGGVRRKLAPNDDEDFRVFEVWTGERFVREGS